jgi:hypothetical protein
MGNVLNKSVSTENRASKFGYSLRRVSLNETKPNRCELETTNKRITFKFGTLKGILKIKIKAYL